MCGIVAAHGRPDHERARAMLGRLAHRGPDGEGHVRLPCAWLGHTRLSIVDVEGGRQPLANRAGSAYLVANGEIYNHRSLRHDLHGRMLTRSDSEVALHLYERDGPRGLARLRGMFALAAATTDGRFVAARDPVGIKPLYWARRDGLTLFASELKAYDPAWRSRVRPFPPACYWTPEEGLVRLWEVPAPAGREAAGPAGDGAEPPPEVLAALRERLVTAVERRLMSDVPVGVFLSGGLDSSLVAAIAARAAARDGRRLASFAVGLADSPDLAAARQVAELLGTDHHERVYAPEELRTALPRVVEAIESFDPMLIHSAVPNYLLAELAARHVKVVLTGEGADELFAGYEHHRRLGDGLADALVGEVRGLHNLNLQRCDRVTMAHGLEARVPFLDVDVIELALTLDPRWRAPAAGRVEKWLLRRAFRGWLPDAVLMRRKEQFGDGTGASAVLRRSAAAEVDDAEFRRLRSVADPPLRTREEVFYWRLFAERLQGVDTAEVVGRFAVA